MRKKQAAFTLVEAIVAMGILSMVLLMVYQTFYSVLQTTKIGADATERVQRERIVLRTIEDALSGIVYYEQNQEHYAFVADTLDFNYPSISFVSRVPPDFIGNKEFGAQGLRRIEFVVEDAPVAVKVEVNGKTKKEIRNERALVMYQIPILQSIDATELENPKRWVLGPGLDTFMVLFWSTINNEWLPDWEETNSVPTRLKFEVAFKLNDGSSPLLTDIHKREIVVFSDTITQAMQNPKMPASKSRGSRKSGKSGKSSKGKGGDRNSAPRRPSEDQLKRIADWRRQQEEAKKKGKPKYTAAQIAEYKRKMAERAKAYAKAKQGGGDGSGPRFTPPVGGGNNSGGGNNNGSGSGSRIGSGTGIPGQSQINTYLMGYEETMGQPATSLQDLVDKGFIDDVADLPPPPPGTEWQVENGQVSAVLL